MNMRTDPTTGRRLVEATRRMTPLVDHMSSLIEHAPREVDIDPESFEAGGPGHLREGVRGRGRRRVGNPAAGAEVHRDERAGA